MLVKHDSELKFPEYDCIIKWLIFLLFPNVNLLSTLFPSSIWSNIALGFIDQKLKRRCAFIDMRSVLTYTGLFHFQNCCSYVVSYLLIVEFPKKIREFVIPFDKLDSKQYTLLSIHVERQEYYGINGCKRFTITCSSNGSKCFVVEN